MLRVESKALYVKPSSSFALTASSSSDDDESDSSSSNNNNNNNNCDADKHNACERDAYADADEREPLLAGSGNQENAQLQEENARLRRQVADLTSALVVRDMEIASLQERCQLLLASVEQQDEVIAKIYAAAAATGSSSSASAPVLIPTPVNASAVDAHKQRSRHGIATLFASKRDSNSNSHYAKKSLLTNTQRSPGAGATVITVPPATTTLAAEPARELLEAQLESIGYQPQEATHALESLAEGVPLLTRRSSVESAGESASVGMLDRLLFPSPPKSEPLFGTTGSSHLRSTPRSTATSPDVSFGKAHRHTPFLERQTSEEDFAKSAGFLRKANRKLSGRLSVSDFGLLSDDTPLFGRSASEEPDPTSVDQPEDDGSDASDGSLKRAQSRRTASQRNLFAEIDVAASEDAKRKKQQPASGEKDEDELTYAEFLERIRLPASRDVLNRIRVFVGSILGPRGDGKPPRSSDYVDYDFYGHHEFTRRYERFFRKMDEVLAAHPAWRHASETTLSKARDGIEKYVMDKLSDIAFNQLPVCQQWKTEDDELFRRMKLLSFVTPDMLDIKPCMRNEVVWSMAEDELRRINSFRAPGDKINCIVRCCSVIFSVLNLSRGDSGNRPGADDFLPVFIYIVLHSQIPRLCSNCEYIAAYRNPADLMSKAGYCFVNLRSAIEFINVLDASMLSLPADEFDRLFSERERLLHEQNGKTRR